MPARSLSAQKIRNIITLNAHSRSSYRELSRLSDVASSTVGKYLSAFAHQFHSQTPGACLTKSLNGFYCHLEPSKAATGTGC
jgi:hypothetical protein